MEYIFNGETFIIDEEELEYCLYIIGTDYILGQDNSVIRYDCICDIKEFQDYVIGKILKLVSNSVIFDLSLIEKTRDYNLKRKEYFQNGKIILVTAVNEFIDKLEFIENIKLKDEREKVFYNLLFNMKRDYFKFIGLKYHEIMFLTNQQYRIYVNYAFDTVSMSSMISLNRCLKRKTDGVTLDQILEEKYLGKKLIQQK